MDCGISTACFYPEPLENTVDRIATLGIGVVEVFINTESEFHPAFVRDMKERLDAHGLRVASVHPFTSPMEGQLLLSDYDRRTQDGIAQYRHYFEAAHMLGAHSLTFHGERSIIRDRDAADAARKIAVYAALCDVAAEYDLALAQENVAWCKSESPEYIRRLYNEVPALRYTLDIKQAHRAGHHWSEYLDVMGERIINVHINDFDETHSCMLPGEGVMQYDALFDHLVALGYDDQVLIEVYGSDYESLEQIRRSLRFLDGCAACRENCRSGFSFAREDATIRAQESTR